MAQNTIRKILWASIAVLMVDSIIELSFVSSMVAWLHYRAGKSFAVEVPVSAGESKLILLHGKPLNLLVNQGHTSNGAAGTAFVLIGLGGILALVLKSKAFRPQTILARFTAVWYPTWLVLTVLSVLLTLAALIFTFVITNAHSGQIINLDAPSAVRNFYLDGVNTFLYVRDAWTPENWCVALLQLHLTSPGEISDIQSHLDVMRGWRWNLIPMFLIGLVVAGVALADARLHRHAQQAGVAKSSTHSQQVGSNDVEEKGVEKSYVVGKTSV